MDPDPSREQIRRERRRRTRSKTAGTFRYIEDVSYAAIAIALTVGGAALFARAVWVFVASVVEAGIQVPSVLALLDQLLLVFIFSELVHTVRAIIDETVLLTEPFLIVGIVAAIRRLIVISAEASERVGEAAFGQLMLEMGILIGAVLGLGLTIYLLRHTEHSEPRPAHEPDVGN